ncbi:unnamed protein product [Ranitomeya imitator]|uniref:Uncharacterized protein n=1 Tax=Ranitomeya imitator TaxID=111125 RepID=A0ABN9L2V0_9NEOB|nr:unnamed protein product [Ranitomeya imitator]
MLQARTWYWARLALGPRVVWSDVVRAGVRLGFFRKHKISPVGGVQDLNGEYGVASHPVQTAAKPHAGGASNLHTKNQERLDSSPFIDPKEADWMFEQLESEIPWSRKPISAPMDLTRSPGSRVGNGEVPLHLLPLHLQPNLIGILC